MISRSRLARLTTSVVLAATAAVAAPSTAQAAVPVGGGTPLLFGGTALCTAGVAGTDADGREVVFTAGHCSNSIGEPVTLAADQGAGVIGTVLARNEVLDYTVVGLEPGRAFPVRQPGVTGTGPIPAPGEVVCKDGASTGHTCGVTWQGADGIFWSQACAGHGDSGGPVIRGDRLVGLLSGGEMPPAAQPVGGSLAAILPPCMNPFQAPFFLPAYAVSFDRVLADATDRGWPGAGFRMA